MTQDQHPHDPFAAERAADAPSEPTQPAEQDHAPAAPQDSASDLLAVDPEPSAAPQHDPYAQQPQHDPYAQQPQHDPYAQQPQQAEYGQPSPQPAVGAATISGSAHQSGTGSAGGYDEPLSGEPVSPSDSRLWAMFSQLAVVLGHVVSWGFLGWVGPLIIFLMYKDRDRLVRDHSAEALNGAIAVLLAEVVLGVAIGILGLLTFTIGWVLFPLVGIPALVQLVFSIIGAVKANQGEFWRYPLNIRFVK